MIHNRIRKFLSVLESAAFKGKPIDLSMGYRSLTSDIVTSYMFADKGFQLLEAEDFQSPILVALEQFFNIVQWAIYFQNFFPWLTRQLQKLSKEQTEMISPPLAATNWITEVHLSITQLNEADFLGSNVA